MALKVTHPEPDPYGDDGSLEKIAALVAPGYVSIDNSGSATPYICSYLSAVKHYLEANGAINDRKLEFETAMLTRVSSGLERL